MTRAPPKGPAVNVLLQIRVEGVLQRARVAVVVFGDDEDEGVRARDGGGEAGVFDGVAFVSRGQVELADVYQLGLDAGPLRDLLVDEARGGLAQAALADGAEDDGDEERA